MEGLKKDKFPDSKPLLEAKIPVSVLFIFPKKKVQSKIISSQTPWFGKKDFVAVEADNILWFEGTNISLVSRLFFIFGNLKCRFLYALLASFPKPVEKESQEEEEDKIDGRDERE